MRKANGQTTTCPKEAADFCDLLVESFASVFTRKKAQNENGVLENMAEQMQRIHCRKRRSHSTAELIKHP